ncbi:MAG: tetratricopeptide repeat protein [Candidatus Obscuribacterales bacterium]|nr:tetratricopeptide repeat protein [Candidatus Obscuribacterales bacterium]
MVSRYNENKAALEKRLVLLQLLMSLCLLGVSLDLYYVASYCWPVTEGDYEFASGSYLADSGNALYDGALVAYSKENYPEAVRLLNLAGEHLHDSAGNPLESKRALASNIQFLLGNVLVKQKQTGQAIEAYRAALRLNPDHRYAKYNLELLARPQLGGDGAAGSGGSGGEGGQSKEGDADGDPQDPSKGKNSGSPNKGI